jgi:hypothetical protein
MILAVARYCFPLKTVTVVKYHTFQPRDTISVTVKSDDFLKNHFWGQDRHTRHISQTRNGLKPHGETSYVTAKVVPPADSKFIPLFRLGISTPSSLHHNFGPPNNNTHTV